MADIGPAMHANHSHGVDAHECIQCMIHIGALSLAQSSLAIACSQPQLDLSPSLFALYHNALHQCIHQQHPQRDCQCEGITPAQEWKCQWR